jgi:hypothetical protein
VASSTASIPNTLAPTAARCITCGYALRELTENRCPECGRSFDPHDSLTMYTPLYRQRVRTANWVPIVLFSAVLFALALLPNYFPWHLRYRLVGDETGLRRVAWTIGALIIAWCVRGRARRAILGAIPDTKRRSERWGRAVVVLGAFAMIVYLDGGITSWSCPHGDSTRFGPIVITRNSDYGPCGNYCIVLVRMRIGHDTFLSIAD